MATFVEINNIRYPATIGGKMVDKDWNNRASKYIRITTTYEQACQILKENTQWYIIQQDEIIDENNEINIIEERYDNSEYSIAGEVIDHRDGTITIKMGKPTAEEILAIILGEIE